MQPPRIPADDVERIAALESLGLLDSAPEERFDRITRTAATLLGTPIALINLVDGHRQWSKSAVGMPFGGQAERRISFCAHVVGDDAPVYVDDTAADARFADNPQVTEDPPALRAYHGVPVRGMTGHVLGSLCIADTRPRELDDAERQVLIDLSGWVEAEFDRTELSRLTVRELHARRRLEAIADAVADGIVVVGADGTIGAVNPAAQDLLAEDAPLERGRALREVLAAIGLDRAAVQELEGPETVHRVTATLAESGHEIEVTSTDLSDQAGRVLVLRDVTEQRALARRKDEFTATVSHELRTPLTSIKGTLGLLAAGVVGEIDAEAADLLRVADGNTERLIRLVNDILDVDRLTSGRLELHPEHVRLAEVVRAAVDAVAGAAATAGVHLEVDVVDGDSHLDVDRTVQILTNVLGNAIRFSPDGGRVRVTGRADADGTTVAIADEGRGIPAHQFERIFDRFAQVDASDRRERAGTGLGLPIARGLAERHGGRLEVASTLGAGSTFTLTLPASVATSTPTDAADEPTDRATEEAS